jgi:hypothetical protein
MSLTNRPIIPKQPKIKNSQLVKHYRSQHKQCEVCVLDGEYTPADDLHHIIPGHGRTDQIWNIIMLCRKHHILCTEHIQGERGKRMNIMMLAIKYLKAEIGDTRLRQIGLYDETMVAVPLLEKQFNLYKRGLL